MVDFADDREPGKPGKGKCERREPHSLTWPPELWREFSKRAIDEDVDRSALMEKWVRERLARYGPKRKGSATQEEVSASQDDGVNLSVETLPDSETVQPPPAEIEAPIGGEGEGVRAPSRKRR